ncbi:MAG: DNA mismatch repair protein MutS [Treponema sp.]|jgi:DNA mismatch repair protein MutS|nr:DNA mismatch repair protein MutS [Treponema sp.]
MLDQYRRIKAAHQDAVLFFRLGDFYEMFSDDAVAVSALLNLTLTSRNGLPMCGIPYHAARSYIARLLKRGKKIAICEQISEPGKGLIERKVVEVITPGTTVDEDYLDRGSSNYLASLASASQRLSFAYIDLSTGDFHATAFPVEDAAEWFRQELERLQLTEMIVQESLLEANTHIARAIADRSGLVVNRWADWLFDIHRSRKRLERQFGTSNLRGFGLEEKSPEIVSAGALLDYLDDTAQSLIPHVRSLIVYRDNEYLGIDESSQRNLEIIKNLRDGDVRFSLLEVMDETRTAMGRRLLKGRLLQPLRNLEHINQRLDMVEMLYRDQGRLGAFRELMGKTPDLERLIARLAMDRAHGKDMVLVQKALSAFKTIEELNAGCPFSFESEEAASLDVEGCTRLMAVRDLLEQGLCDEPSILLTEGNLIREGYNATLDTLHQVKENGRKFLEEYVMEEREATGIANLKMSHNRLIGYFFEVTKAQLSKVPSHFIRRQGIVTGERFTTDRLASLESDINGASDKVIELEKQLFLELREQAKALIPELAAAGRRIAELDVAQSLARAATIQGWVRPVVDNGNRLAIIEGRHPVVEAHLPRGEFIANDVKLDGEGISFAMITGPNMAGKSTYLRQAALITIMAQAGSFVPAWEAIIGMTDRIYCRVGASDNLARGESTFLVEMNETAYILHTATARSLVIMDEVGRGTGTIDGLAIAWAVSEELLDHIQCRTLFATHFHELSMLSHPRLANRSMEVLDRDGEIIFLRQLIEGPAAESYGLHVARLAGLSERVLDRASSIMERLQETGKVFYDALPGSTALDASSLQMVPLLPGSAPESPPAAPNDRGDHGKAEQLRFQQFLEDIRAVDPDRMTPLEALDWIHTWKQVFSGKIVPRPRSRRNSPSNTENPSLFDFNR